MRKHKNIASIIKRVMFEKGMGYANICKKLGIEEKDFKKCMAGKQELKVCEFISLCIFLKLKPKDFRKCTYNREI